MKTDVLKNWTTIACKLCGDLKPPRFGMATEFGFLCDDCLNTDPPPHQTLTTYHSN
jgi:hypothetical protein